MIKLSKNLNGNRICTYTDHTTQPARSFSVFTLDNMPLTHNMGSYHPKLEATALTELTAYITEHGNDRQRDILDIETPATDQSNYYDSELENMIGRVGLRVQFQCMNDDATKWLNVNVDSIAAIERFLKAHKKDLGI